MSADLIANDLKETAEYYEGKVAHGYGDDKDAGTALLCRRAINALWFRNENADTQWPTLVAEWQALMEAHKGDDILSDYTIRDMLNLGNKLAHALHLSIAHLTAGAIVRRDATAEHRLASLHGQIDGRWQARCSCMEQFFGLTSREAAENYAEHYAQAVLGARKEN